MKALQICMIEMNSAVAAERITEALKSQVPLAADRLLRIDDDVMVYRDTDKVLYPGYIVKNILGKQVQVIDRLGEELLLTSSQTSPPSSSRLN
jgi:hypothetical protein